MLMLSIRQKIKLDGQKLLSQILEYGLNYRGSIIITIISYRFPDRKIWTLPEFSR